MYSNWTVGVILFVVGGIWCVIHDVQHGKQVLPLDLHLGVPHANKSLHLIPLFPGRNITWPHHLKRLLLVDWNPVEEIWLRGLFPPRFLLLLAFKRFVGRVKNTTNTFTLSSKINIFTSFIQGHWEGSVTWQFCFASFLSDCKFVRS